MKKRLISITVMTVALLVGCSPQASELEQIRKNKEEHVPMMERSPYKEISSYLNEEKPEEIINTMANLTYPAMTKGEISAGHGQRLAQLYLIDLEAMKTMSTNKPLDDFIEKVSSYFEAATETTDEEVQYKNIAEGQKLLKYLYKTAEGIEIETAK